MPSNKAAWLTQANKPLEVREAPYTSPNAGEVVVKVHAVAINPIDWLKAGKGFGMVLPWIKLPFVQGIDLAGKVVEIGPGGDRRLKVGERVFSEAMGNAKEVNDSTKGAFQLYTVCVDHLTTRIPDSVSYEEASVIPLAATTAACALFQRNQLNLPLPTVPPRSPVEKTVLVWGGSTSVGCNAIQLAVAAGYDVVTTCSPRNFALCEKLGARQCFDYNSKTVIPDLVKSLGQNTFVGALSIGINSDEPCFDVVSQCEGGKFISMVSFPRKEPEPKILVLPRTIAFFASWFVTTTIKSWIRGITWRLCMVGAIVLYRIRDDLLMEIFQVDQVPYNGIGKALYSDYFEKALKDGSYVAAPQPEVVGKGLESIQVAYAHQEKGMSARKAVVSVQD